MSSSTLRIVLSTLLIAVPPAVAAQGAPGAIAGSVKDAFGNPIRHAQVKLPAIRRGQLTDSLGRFVLTGVPSGRYVLRSGFPGYETSLDTVTVESGRTREVAILLSPDLSRCDKPDMPVARLGPVQDSMAGDIRDESGDSAMVASATVCQSVAPSRIDSFLRQPGNRRP